MYCSIQSQGVCFFFFQEEDGIRVLVRSRGFGDVYKRQVLDQERAGNHEQDVVARYHDGSIQKSFSPHGKMLLIMKMWNSQLDSQP